MPFDSQYDAMHRPEPALTLPPPPPELAELSQTLGERIAARIRQQGPIGFADYMRMALYEPGLGYYQNGLHKFGSQGDFITAPEQGALFATALARQLEELMPSLPADWTLLELGAGSGALARDLLQTLEHPPARYLILDTSATLRQVQADTLASLPESLQARVEWLDQPPDTPFDGVLLANEVLDALPVACVEWTDGQIMERAVTVRQDRLDWVHRPAPPRLESATRTLTQALGMVLPDGYHSEICLDLPAWMKTVTEPLRRGLALFIDYGYPRREYYHPDRHQGTLVCHYRHRAHFDPFVWPGLTDLSAFVDFSLAAEAGFDAGLEVAGFTSQAGFLLSLGIHELVDQADNDHQRLQRAAELKRLTLPGEMGEKFKLLALTRDLDKELGGFGLLDQLDRL
ncbi:MAG: class I SAM-dependent methyltransferase [Wenzhouxiangella sp.]